jgi:polyhydroxyalkanoate synthase subunit PhaC
MSNPDATMTTGAAAESIGGGEAVGMPSLGQAASGLAAALGQGAAVVGEATRLGVELIRIASGRSDAAPAKGDRRFTDPAWTSNPAFRMIGQSYLASAQAMDRIVAAMGDGRSDNRAEQARFAATIVTSAAAPTNFLATNPAALKRAFDTGGMSLARGARNFARDVRRNGAMPSMIEPDAFEVGRDLAVTPGAVVARDPVAELLQYTPATDTVFARPVLIVPPPIGRYYFLDLRPGRSFAEYAVSRGLQTYLLSWRNPTAEQGSWDLDTYARAVLAAIDTAREITGSPDVNLIGFCAGGIIATTVLNYPGRPERPPRAKHVVRGDPAGLRAARPDHRVLRAAAHRVRRAPVAA